MKTARNYLQTFELSRNVALAGNVLAAMPSWAIKRTNFQ